MTFTRLHLKNVKVIEGQHPQKASYFEIVIKTRCEMLSCLCVLYVAVYLTQRVLVSQVFAVLSLQLFVTCGVVAVFTFERHVKLFVQLNDWTYWVGYVVFLVPYFILSCCSQFRRKHPWNLIALVSVMKRSRHILFMESERGHPVLTISFFSDRSDSGHELHDRCDIQLL